MTFRAEGGAVLWAEGSEQLPQTGSGAKSSKGHPREEVWELDGSSQGFGLLKKGNRDLQRVSQPKVSVQSTGNEGGWNCFMGVLKHFTLVANILRAGKKRKS